MKELLIHKNNIDRILRYKEHEADKKKEHDRQ